MNEPNAIAVVAEDRGLSTALSVEQVRRHVNLVQTIMRDVLKDGEHYGKVPGCGDRPALLKSGAEKLLFTFQLVPSHDVIMRELPGGHREYEVRTRVATRSGALLAEGVGTCSSMESKYRWRGGKRRCPACQAETIIKTKGGRTPGGYWCVPDKGGCGANFPPGDRAVEGQELVRAENTDPADVFNTVLKMAKKRSMVDAAITATAASDIFTQDVDEDLERADSERAAPVAASQAAPAAPAAQTAPAAPKPAAPAAPPAKDAAPAQGIREQNDALYRKLAQLDKATAALLWKHSAKLNDKPHETRHQWLTDALAALTAWHDRLGIEKMGQWLSDLLDQHGLREAATTTTEGVAKLAEAFRDTATKGAA